MFLVYDEWCSSGKPISTPNLLIVPEQGCSFILTQRREIGVKPMQNKIPEVNLKTRQDDQT